MMWKSPIDGRPELECNNSKQSDGGASRGRAKERDWQGKDKKGLPRCGGGDGEQNGERVGQRQDQGG